MKLQDYVPSLIRTWVPILVTFLVTLAADNGIVIDEATSNAATAAIAGLAGAIYYALVRLLEAKVGPAWGWLLGLATAPKYPQPKAKR
jgi:hypothetical protein